MLVFSSDGQRKQNDGSNLIGNTGFCSNTQAYSIETASCV